MCSVEIRVLKTLSMARDVRNRGTTMVAGGIVWPWMTLVMLMDKGRQQRKMAREKEMVSVTSGLRRRVKQSTN